MARKIIIGEILNLIKGLGGNPQKFMGTKTNINFLGKGPKQALFQGQIDIDGLMQSGFPLERVIGEAETAGGYAVANKLNDLQLQRLKDNLITLQKAYTPVANITDMASRTGDLTPGGLASLKVDQAIKSNPEYERLLKLKQKYPDKFPTADESLTMTREEALKKYPPSRLDDLDLPPTGGLMTRISDRMSKIKNMSDELGQVGKGDVRRGGTELTGESGVPGDIFNDFAGVRTTFNPRNEVHVQKAKALLEDPQLKGVYTEHEVKNAYDFEGLYQSHFDKGHVDVAELLQRAGHNIPQMRASARSALLDLMKKEQGGSGLKDFVDEVDFKYISEGGGGRAGDPINLFVKYFGKNAAENLPKNATKENINAFTDFIMKSKDSRGRGIDDPFFDRESIDFSTLTGIVDDIPPFEAGGRVGFRLGGFGGKFTKAQVLIARLKNTIKGSKDKYVQETFPNFIKEIEANPEIANNEAVWKALGEGLPKNQRLVVHGDDTVDFFRQTEFGPHNIENITRFLEQHPFLTRKEAIRILKMEPEDRILEITRLETIRRTPNASGGLAKILEV